MKRFFMILGASVLALVVLVLGYAGALYAGWVPVPGFVTGWVAQAKGLSPGEARSLDRTVNLYHVLKTSPAAPLVDKAIALAAQGAGPAAWVTWAEEAWPQVDTATKQRVKEQLGIADADFHDLETIVDRQVDLAKKEGQFQLTAREAERLNQFDRDYHLMETLQKLR